MFAPLFLAKESAVAAQLLAPMLLSGVPLNATCKACRVAKLKCDLFRRPGNDRLLGRQCQPQSCLLVGGLCTANKQCLHQCCLQRRMQNRQRHAAFQSCVGPKRTVGGVQLITTACGRAKMHAAAYLPVLGSARPQPDPNRILYASCPVLCAWS